MRATQRHFSTIWEHTCDNSPTDSSSGNWWSPRQGVETLDNCSILSSLIRSFFRRISLCVFPCRKTTKLCRLGDRSQPGNGFYRACLRVRIQTFFDVLPRSLCSFCILVVRIPSIPDAVQEYVLQGPRFPRFVPQKFHQVVLLPCHFHVVHNRSGEINLFRGACIGSPIQVLSPNFI